MNIFTVDFSNSLCTQAELLPLLKKLEPEIERVKKSFSDKYCSVYASLNLPTDVDYHAMVQAMIDEKKQLLLSSLFVIGIGGSNLGIQAIQEALGGILYNETEHSLKIYYADTVDADYLQTLLMIAQKELQQGNHILVNVITKSGATTETIVNFELFIQLLQHYHPDTYNDYIVVTTDENSVLWEIGKKNNYSLIPIPFNVGGRFSVLSAVGLFPLGMLHMPIYDLLAGAASMLPLAVEKIDYNLIAHSAATMYVHYCKGIVIQDMFVFSHQLRSIGAWYRQLMGESIGKEKDIHGNIVEVGITPTVSVGSVDLHSVGQLYLGGPRDKCSTFVIIENNAHEILVPHLAEFEKSVANIQGKSVSSIMHALVEGVKTAYQKNQRPFVALALPEISAWYVGQLLQFKMIEMMYLGYVLEINPFDQPNVESYKTETRKLLAQ